jgi:4-amino-4-deoxy-L-arabinose transferase-like glycosyltransferase
MDAATADARPGPWAWAGALLLGAALLSLPWSGHVDDVDAQLYQVVARHVAAGDGWLDLRYLPGAYDHFREHLPFGFWPAAAAIRLFGERAIGPVSALFTLGMLALVGWAASRLAGPWAGLAALLSLATCESIWRYGGRLWLDPPLVLLATASAVPALLPRPRARAWLLAGVLAALAALVKGPFGLLPLPCAAFAAAVAYREPRRLLWGGLATLAGAAPVAAFLLADRFHGDGSWWHGYFVAQISASATGRRSDGRTIWWYPFRVVLGRFWPGLPFAGLAVWRALSRRQPAPVERLLSLFAGALLVGLCLPHRKWWNHELVAFPALALLAGAGAAPWLRRWLGSSAPRTRWVGYGLTGAAALVAAASIAGLGARLLLPPCVGSTEFAAALDRLPPGSPVLVVAPTPDWSTLASLAAERRLSAWPVMSLPAAPTTPAASGVAGAHLALAHAGEALPPPWEARLRARGWVLAERP